MYRFFLPISVCGVVRNALLLSLLVVLVMPARADDTAEANRLLVEAVGLVRQAELTPSPKGKYRLLKKAHDNLTMIVERYPSTALAVKLATGQAIGNISLRRVRQAMRRLHQSDLPTATGAPVRAWTTIGTPVVSVAPAGRTGQLLIASQNGTAELRDFNTGELLRTWKHRGGASSVAVSPGGRRMLMANRGGTVAMYNVRSGRRLNAWEHERQVTSVALSRDQRTALVGAGNAALLIDVRALKIRQRWRHRSPVTTVAYASNGRWILAGFADGLALLGDVSTGRVLHRLEHPGSGGGGVMSADFSPDGLRVLVGAANRAAVLWDVASGRTLRKWNRIGQRVSSVAYGPGGSWVLTGDAGYEVELHDINTGRTVRKWRYGSSPKTISFSRDGRHILMGFVDGSTIVCQLRFPKRNRGYVRTYLTHDKGCW